MGREGKCIAESVDVFSQVSNVSNQPWILPFACPSIILTLAIARPAREQMGRTTKSQTPMEVTSRHRSEKKSKA